MAIILPTLVAASLCGATILPGSLRGIETYRPLEHSHIVFSGTVLDLTPFTPTLSEWGLADSQSLIMLTRVRIRIDDVLKGKAVDQELTIVVEDSIPFVENEVLLICARWHGAPIGGAYCASSFTGIYQRGDDMRWIRWIDDPLIQRADTVSHEEVRVRIARADLASVSRAADLVAHVQLTAISEARAYETDGRAGAMFHYGFRVIELVKGAVDGGEGEFVIPSGHPRYRSGLVSGYATRDGGRAGMDCLLRREGSWLFPFEGPNSLLRITGGSILYDNKVEYSYGVKQAMQIAREAVVGSSKF